MDIITTKRLVLKPLDINVLDDFYEYAKRDTVGPSAGWAPHKNIDESLFILNLMMTKNDTWSIIYNEKMIGTISLSEKSTLFSKHKIRELGYSISDDYWNLGFGTEAAKALIEYGFKKYKLNKIVCGHLPTNLASKRIIDKCGFKYSNIDYRLNHINEYVEIWMYELTKKMYLGE